MLAIPLRRTPILRLGGFEIPLRSQSLAVVVDRVRECVGHAVAVHDVLAIRGIPQHAGFARVEQATALQLGLPGSVHVRLAEESEEMERGRKEGRREGGRNGGKAAKAQSDIRFFFIPFFTVSPCLAVSSQFML